jgi:hypothetical protein
MAIDPISYGATLRDRFVAAATRDDQAAAQRLSSLVDGHDGLAAQREDAWSVLSTAIRWAARALEHAGVSGTDDTPIRDSEAAFARAQHLERQLFALSQLPDYHDREALLVDSIQHACYAAAELGPIQGGRLSAVGRIAQPVQPAPADLQEIGNDAGEALYRLDELGLGDIVTEASKALAPAA